MSFHFLAKGLSSLYLSSTRHHHLTPLLRLFSSAQSHEINLANYLISSFRFSPDRALKISTYKHVAARKSLEQPESVITFLRDTGLSDDQIKAVVSFYTPLLSFNVEKTLKPRVRQLIDDGFSGELLVQLIRYNPTALVLKDTLWRLQFWRVFSGNDNEVLLKMIKNNGLLITYDIQKYVVPRINLFKEYGLSNRDIAGALAKGYGCCMSRSLDSLKHVLDFIEEAGIPRGSGMFLLCFKTICSYNKDKIERNVDFFKMTYGWSQEEVYTAFKKSPMILAMSMDKVRTNMNFLIREAKLEPRSIASHPVLLGFSLQKRLVPRHHVLSILATKGLKRSLSLSTACFYSEKRFFEKYIEPYKKDVPELAEAYLAACGGNIPA
ncbi:Mitochondrial transcription termination factor-like [Rhynchospora pubera]|uniref:Mitochondrial transcription termination factor-like n=1 Tax=Rhynchospora pubera TaxID=906938 RepID=A0AAV8BNX3_9POAL|nr:Mitochondrial transcription termination factor-like [Rhynchospora pubera]